MKRKPGKRNRDRDTMRPEYDFSGTVRGATAARYAPGANIAFTSSDAFWEIIAKRRRQRTVSRAKLEQKLNGGKSPR